MEQHQQLLETVRAIVHLLEEISTHTATLAEAAPAAYGSAEPERLLDMQEVIDYLGIDRSTYFRLVKNGELTPRRKGRRHYYYRGDLHAALAESVRRGRV